MKTKTLKIVVTILMAVFTLCTISQTVLATSILNSISANTTGVQSDELVGMANNILGLIQVAAAVATVILVAVFGFKFIMGSANEKADYQKSFIPLIVGVVVVFAASSIAKLLFSTFATTGS